MRYLLWSGARRAWWKPREDGYTKDITEAGWYTVEQAAVIEARSAPRGDTRTRAVPLEVLALNWLECNVPEGAR